MANYTFWGKPMSRLLTGCNFLNQGKGKGAGLKSISGDTTLLAAQITPRSSGLFILDSISTPWGAYSLAAHWGTELIDWHCHHCPHCIYVFYFVSMKGSGHGLAQGPHYDRFNQDSNP